MDKQQLKALKHFKKAKHLQMLNYGQIVGHYLQTANLSHHLSIYLPDCAADNVLVDINLLTKTNDLQLAIDAAKNKNISDFPCLPDIGKTSAPMGDVISGLSALIPACSVDTPTYAHLNYVYVNAEKSEAVATDGHKLFLKTHAARESFLIHPFTIKLCETLGNISSVMLSKREQKSTESFTYITITGQNWQLTSRTDPGPYPPYEKVIPDYSKNQSTTWDASTQAQVSNAITQLLPITPGKNSMIVLSNNAAFCKNRDIKVTKQIPFSAPILPISPEHMIGFNAKYLQIGLDFIDGRPISLTCRDADDIRYAVIFKGDSFLYLQMPLRILDDKYDNIHNLSTWLAS
jgi:DNA polymerase III sliding clamp (beta) subunit (PCNA family)